MDRIKKNPDELGSKIPTRGNQYAKLIVEILYTSLWL